MKWLRQLGKDRNRQGEVNPQLLLNHPVLLQYFLFAEFKGNAELMINVSMGVNKKLQNSYSSSYVKCTRMLMR